MLRLDFERLDSTDRSCSPAIYLVNKVRVHENPRGGMNTAEKLINVNPRRYYRSAFHNVFPRMVITGSLRSAC